MMHDPRILLADIGGTHTRLAIFQPGAAKFTATDVQEEVRIYQNRSHASLRDVVEKFFEETGRAPCVGAVMAAAGVITDGESINANVPWRISAEDIGQSFGLDRVKLINDLEAMAAGVRYLSADSFAALRNGQPINLHRQIAVLGVGTGFGCAVLIPGAARTTLRSEAGQARFRAADPQEFNLLELIRRDIGRAVRVDDVLSGPGLEHIHNALRELEGLPPLPAKTPEIIALAQNRPGSHERSAVEIHCRMTLRFAADLALKFGAFGGVLFVGGVMPRLRRFLSAAIDEKAFDATGPLAVMLDSVPLAVCISPRLALIGAAAIFARDCCPETSRET